MKTALLILFFTSSIIGFAQTKTNDFELLVIHCNGFVPDNSKHIGKYKVNPFDGLLFLYKKILSMQISAHCEFEPSCSSFSLRALHELGYLKGIFLTADRLTRCNGSASNETQHYLIIPENGKIKDIPFFYRHQH